MITYKNLDDQEVTEEFWFNISKTEVAERHLANGPDYARMLEGLTMERDGEKIVKLFKDLLSSSVGRREGSLFIKDDDARNRFMFSGAYDAFFMELLTSPDSGARELAAIFPKEAQSQALDELRKRGLNVDAPVIEGVAGDAVVQATKPQPVLQTPEQLRAAHQVTDTQAATDRMVETLKQEPTTGPQTPSGVGSANPGTDDEPTWLKEMRNPTRQELMKMSKEEMQLAAKMRESGVLK
jgi:hypothetical protein